jgi:tetratricopeptide (TPR) repeat protein
MSPRRKGHGRPIDGRDWPRDGARRDFLEHCDKIHRGNGLPALRLLAERMGLSAATRVGDILRGHALPADEKQARSLLEALGAVGAEVEKGLHLYRVVRTESADRYKQIRRPDWWPRSGYLDQVRDIAPQRLLDRHDELAELADWCAGGAETYVWWQAGPRAGKSALMSWFVLHPPPGVWVVSFFVTARYTGQADSTAFTDEMIDQLAAITGQPVPPITSARGRDRLRRHLFKEAAARAAKTGHQLVLLVDGLDEDCGTQPRSGLPSIARCLPKHPADGARVIVSGRTDPPLPADITADRDHPLHQCRVRALAVSPHAHQVMQLAQDELDQVLATDRDRHDGLGYQVLGLVTASGGGLEHHDLHELTNQPAYRIDQLLRGVFGRTIAGRADPHATQRVFLFTHETLRIQAIDRLGPHIVAGFAERLHTWALSYQRRSWPADTPAYLLRGYPAMLADTKDVHRLMALATDPARHARMLDATGGDTAALADIATAQTLNIAQPHADIAAALRLAWYRDHLADRNTHIPTHLPAAWATLGQAIRAESLARSITDADQQTEALVSLVAALAEGGEHERAEQIARSITGADQQAQALVSLVAALAEGGEHERAEQIARSITGAYKQAQALTELARAAAAAGDYERAEQISESLTDAGRQAQVHCSLARATAVAGDYDRALAMAMSAGPIARSINDPDRQVQALTDLAQAVAAAGEHHLAEQIARSTSDPSRQVQVLCSLVEAAVAAGEHDRACLIAIRAEQVSGLITDPGLEVGALIDVARMVAAAGEHKRARAMADSAEQIAQSSIIDPYEQAMALTGLARVVAAAGEAERASAMAMSAERIARSVTDPSSQAKALTGLARVVAAAGEQERASAMAMSAERIARSVTDPSSQAKALTGLARVVAAAGEQERASAMATSAEQIARSITDPSSQAKALTDLADVVVAAGFHEQAEQIARSIAHPGHQAWTLGRLVPVVAAAGDHERAELIARSIPHPGQQAWALAGLVEAVAGCGEHERAERIAGSIADPYQKARAVISLANAVAGRDWREGAEQTVSPLIDSYHKEHAPSDLGRVVAAAGEHERTERNARSITDPYLQGLALTDLSRALGAVGEHERAEQIVRSIAHPDQQAQALTELADGADPDTARSLIVSALAVGRWTIPLNAVALLDAKALSDFVDDCILR